MRNIKLNLFEIGTIFWIVASTIVLLLSLMGIFNIYSILLAIGISAIIPIQMYRKKELEIERIHSKNFKFLVSITFIMALSLSFLTTPTIFGGRDEGSYSNSAIMMVNDGHRSHNNKLIENFFNIYGESKALNFPGFQYNSEERLESQFLPGYPNWLAIFYQLFGLNGLKFSNLLPFMTFILSFYLLIVEVFPSLRKNSTDIAECLNGNILKKCWLKLTQAEQLAWVGTIFLMTFMPLLVFYKFTLSEIYFASLSWFSAYLLIRYLKDRRFLKFKTIFVPLFLMLFIRIETIAIIFALLLIMIGKDFNHLKQARYQFFFVLSGLILLVAVWLEPNFFINAAKGISEISGLNANAMPESRESTLLGKMIPDDWQNFYALKIWYNYNLLPFLIMAGTFLVVFFKKIFQDKKFGDEKALIIIPFLLFSPTLIYLIDGNISLDHPWMLRRWIFTIIPILFFYSTFFLFYLRQKNSFLFRLITVFSIIGNIALFTVPSQKVKGQWTNLFTFSQNESLLEQTEELSRLFGEDDLILVSQKSSGSSWSLITEPMRNIFNRQAIYFFNAKDYAELNHENFDNIFLISTDEEEFLYENILKEKIAKRIINNVIINPSRNPSEKPHALETQTKINIYRIYQ